MVVYYLCTHTYTVLYTSIRTQLLQIALWFKPEELAEYDAATKKWVYEN